MAFFLDASAPSTRPLMRFMHKGAGFSWADAIAFLLLAAIAVLMVHGVGQMDRPLAQLKIEPISLSPERLPEYALLTTLRMFAALAGSLLFTFVVGTLAAKSRKAELVIVPALDILQSVPVLGFLTFTVTFFMGLFPGNQFGVECAAAFAIFTSQAWNMTFSFYQSLRTVPADLDEVARQFEFSAWQRFIQLELPFSMPGLVWNTMMSMSGGWFFVVASEAITVGNTTVTLPGIGSWIALAIEHKDFAAIGLAVGAMAVVIVLYDQLVFRPVIAWADKFRFEQTASQARPKSWVYDVLQRTRLIGQLLAVLVSPLRRLSQIGSRWMPGKAARFPHRFGFEIPDRIWKAVVAISCAYACWVLGRFIAHSLSWHDVASVSLLGVVTMIRVVVLILIASAIWVPIGVWIGLRPAWSERVQPVAQFLAAFPANVLFPFAVIVIVGLHLDPNVWLSPLMIFGTQWYILFNVIAGASAIPNDMKEAAKIFEIRGWQWWKQLALPAVFPYYVTGALTASGGSWNASIVSEVVSWGDHQLKATGLGAYIADATQAGDYPRVALGIAVMCLFVIVFNRILWRPMYRYAERHFRIA